MKFANVDCNNTPLDTVFDVIVVCNFAFFLVILRKFFDIQELTDSYTMAEGSLASESRRLSRSMQETYVNTPLGKKATKLNGDLETNARSFEIDLCAPLSPPQTLDTKQKRERSESLMLSQTNDVATKRRLRSRSRLGLAPEYISSAFMSPPCTSKPRERTHSKTQNISEHFFNHAEEFNKHQGFNPEGSSVYMTPLSEPREPLLTKDINTLNDQVDPGDLSISEPGCLSTQPSDSSSSDEDTPWLEYETRTKLDFDQCAEKDGQRKSLVKSAMTPENCKIIGRRMGEKRIDFIKELVNMNCEEICKQIFWNLEPRDLQRVASVSKLWRKICKKDRIASPRLDQFISGRKQHVIRKGKENLGHHTRFDYAVPQRPPFSVKDHNTNWTPHLKGSMAAIEEVKTNIMTTFERIKCPSCGSPSRKTAENTCKCEECCEIFCNLCQHRVDKNHKTGKCAIKLSKSKNIKSRETIGSKKSKERLKRY